MRRKTVKAPPILSLNTGEYEQTIRFLGRVRSTVLDSGLPVSIDLRDCTYISPEIAPLLAAEFHRLRYLKGRQAVTGTSPKDPSVRQTLHGMGFFKTLGLYDPVSMMEGDDMEEVYTINSGTALDGEITKTMSHDLGQALGLDIEIEPLQKALNEALENISEHAYFDTSALPFPAEAGRWWISVITLRDKRAAYVLACDLGMTIPQTVPDTAKRRGASNLALLLRLLSERRVTEDEALLAAAFEPGVTRRPDGKGGRGLGKMAQLMQEFDKGNLTVWSRKAAAILSKGSTEVVTEALPVSFPGTYVLWHLEQDNPE